MPELPRLCLFLHLLCLAWVLPVQGREQITLGSKNFNESYLLGEIIAQALEQEGFSVERKFGLGGTLVCYQALVNGEIDVYVEYTGTLARAILKLDGPVPELEQLNAAVSAQGLRALAPLGFNNTYALVMRQGMAAKKGITRISDLTHHPDLRPAFSPGIPEPGGRLARLGRDLQPHRQAHRH